MKEKTVFVFGSLIAEAAKTSSEDIESTYKTVFWEEERTWIYLSIR